MTELIKLIEFEGNLTFSVIAQLINELKVVMEVQHENVNIYKRILTIMVETLENICKYSDYKQVAHDAEIEFPPVFTLIKQDEVYMITTGNLIRLEDQKLLEEKISTVNNLTQLELRKLYRDIIANGNFNSEGGAGLGFIEIAKSSSRKIDYQFRQVGNSNTFFTIKMEITK